MASLLRSVRDARGRELGVRSREFWWRKRELEELRSVEKQNSEGKKEKRDEEATSDCSFAEAKDEPPDNLRLYRWWPEAPLLYSLACIFLIALIYYDRL